MVDMPTDMGDGQCRIQRGELHNGPFENMLHFDLHVPQRAHGINSRILRPRDTWSDTAAYERTLGQLSRLFAENFEKIGALRNSSPADHTNSARMG